MNGYPQRRPTREEIQAAAGGRVPDVIAPGLKVLFCGINPSLYSAAVGHHFARPGNRFWPALHRSGFTPRQLQPWEDGDLLEYGLGLTNIVPRATAAASELSYEELLQGGEDLIRKVEQNSPQFLAVLGISAYRRAFKHPQAALGLQAERVGGAAVWVLPNPSGLNAHYQVPDLVRLFAELRQAAG